jgi:hypothetical protein
VKAFGGFSYAAWCVTIVVFCLLCVSSLHGQKRAFDLADRDCRSEVLVAVIGDARVYASCFSEGSERVMRVSVSNDTRANDGLLWHFSIQFCGPSVISGSAQVGWVTTVEGDDRQTITWSLPDHLVGSLGLPSGARQGGFVVRLKPGWRMSRSTFAYWVGPGGNVKGDGEATTHDC